MLDDGILSKGARVVFLAETVVREKTIWDEEIPKYKSLFGRDVLQDFNMVFHCYQAKPNQIYNDFEKVDVVICDEVHDCLTAEYYNILSDNKCDYVLCLTGAMSMEANVFLNKVDEEFRGKLYQSDEDVANLKITDYVTKGQLLEMFCPVVFKYTTSEAIEDGVISQFKSFVIEHTLDNSARNIKIWKSYDTRGTEQAYYNARARKMYSPQVKPFMKKNFGRQMANFLYDLPSKTDVVKAVLLRLKGQKTLVFGERLDALRQITPNVVDSSNFNTLIDQFNDGTITTIASSKMLKQGITLDGVQNIIFHSYNSKWHNMEQKRARIRWLDGQQAKLFFVVTKDTLETKWFEKLKKQRDEKGKIVKVHDLNIQSYVDSRLLVDWYKKQIK